MQPPWIRLDNGLKESEPGTVPALSKQNEIKPAGFFVTYGYSVVSRLTAVTGRAREVVWGDVGARGVGSGS